MRNGRVKERGEGKVGNGTECENWEREKGDGKGRKGRSRDHWRLLTPSDVKSWEKHCVKVNKE